MKKSKLIKTLSICAISLGLLTGIGISTNNSSNVHADQYSAFINKWDKDSIASDAQTKRAEIESGIHMDKQYPKLAAYDALTEPHIFNKYIKPAISNYSNAQKKEFNDEYYADSGEYYFKDLNTNHKKSAVHHHIKRHVKKLIRNKRTKKHNKKATRVNKKLNKVHKYVRKTRKHAKKSTRRAKLSKKQFNKLNKQLKADKKALKSRRSKHSYKYRKSLNKAIKQLQKKIKIAK